MTNDKVKEKIKVASYRRVSTKDPEQKTSFEAQKTKLAEFVENIENYELYDMYEDEGISGTKLYDRKDFTRMLIDAGLYVENERRTIFDEKLQKERDVLVFTVYESGKIPKFSRILVKDTARFARNINIMSIIEKLNEIHIYIDFLDLGLTTEKTTDMLIIGFFVNNDALFSKDLSRKVLDGNKNSEKLGILRTNHNLYGYEYIPRGKNKEINNRIKIILDEAKVIQTIFRLYNGCYCYELDGETMSTCDFVCTVCDKKDRQGAGFRVILQILKKLGYKTRKGTDFAATTLKHMFDNEKLCGFVNTRRYDHGTIYAKNSYPKLRENYKLTYDPKSVPPIISKDLFYLCKSKSEERADGKRGKFIGSPTKYKGKLYCPKCGNAYVHNKSHKYTWLPEGYKGFYICKIKRRLGTDVCDSVTVYDDQVDAYVEMLCNGGLNDIISQNNKRLFGTVYTKIISSIIRIRNIDNAQIQNLKKEIAYKSKALANYIELASEADSVDDATREKVQKDNTNISKLQSTLNSLTTPPTTYITEIENLIKICKDIVKLIEEQKPIYTHDELWTIVEKLIVYGKTRRAKTPIVTLVPILFVDVTAKAKLGLDNKTTAISLEKVGVDISAIAQLSIDELHKLLNEIEDTIEIMKTDYI